VEAHKDIALCELLAVIEPTDRAGTFAVSAPPLALTLPSIIPGKEHILKRNVSDAEQQHVTDLYSMKASFV
jgi:hypothetical protein